MGLFKKKIPTEQPISSVSNESFADSNYEEVNQDVEEAEPYVASQMPIAQPQVQARPSQQQRPQQAQPKEEITEDIFKQIIAELDTRLSNIEARLFRRGL